MLATLAAIACASTALAADGRDGGAQLGCGSVIDGRGGAVSGRAQGASVSTRVHRECEGKSSANAKVAAPPPRPRSANVPAEPVATPPRVTVFSGPVNLPADTTQTPSALRGDLVRAGATVVTGGVLIWFLQSSLWASLLVLGVPIWRHVDLLPVVANAADPEQASGAQAIESREDRALVQVLDSGLAAERPDDNPGLRT